MLIDLAIFSLLFVGFTFLTGIPLIGGAAFIAAFELARRCGFCEGEGLEALVFIGAIVGVLIFYVQELMSFL